MSSAGGRARRLLAAYPWRVRAEQGEEIVGTVLDALPPGASRLPVATAVDLVRGGLSMRRRRRPPLPTVLRYRLGLQIHPEWLGWVRDDVDDPGFGRKQALRTIVAGSALLGVLVVVGAMPWLVVPASLPMQLLVARRSVERERSRLRARHGLTDTGPDPDVVWVQRERRALVPDLPVARVAAPIGAALVVGGAVLLVAMTHQRPRIVSFPLEEPAPADALGTAVPAGVLGAVAALWVAGAGLLALRRGPVRPPRGSLRHWSVAALAAAATLVVASLGGALAVRWQWVPWTYGKVGAATVPLGLGLLVLAARTAVAGRRRGAVVRLWQLAPNLGPRRLAWPVARAHEPLVDGATRWSADGPPSPLPAHLDPAEAADGAS